MRVTSLLLLLTSAAAANGAVFISWTREPTPGLNGYYTYTLRAESVGSPIAGFDFAGDPGCLCDRGFFGPMNQVNPAGQGTVFQDANGFFPFVGAQVAQDSQFLFSAAALPAEVATLRSESTSRMTAIFSLPEPVASVDLIQLVIPDGEGNFLGYVGVVGLADGSEVPIDNIRYHGFTGYVNDGTGNCVLVPEPSTLAIAGLAVAGVLGLRRRNG